jgi:formylglycine-generating enzyme required for sulfatase activity
MAVLASSTVGLSGCVRAHERWVLQEREAAGVSDAAGVGDMANGGDMSGGSDAAPLGDSGSDPGAWVRIAAGTFEMGSPAEELCRTPWVSEESQHRVSLTRPFEMAATEVTQGAFFALMSYRPASFEQCEDCPVEQVNWYEAVAYCNALSVREGFAQCYECSGDGSDVTCALAPSYLGAALLECPGYRLPTEAEWEYAYRSGSTAATYEGDLADCARDATVDPIAWYEGNATEQTHPVATKAANAAGLFDMAGNVWEWCHDWHTVDLGTQSVTDPVGPSSGSHRVTRGGSWVDEAGSLRAAMRDSERPATVLNYLGFRCVRSL